MKSKTVRSLVLVFYAAMALVVLCMAAAPFVLPLRDGFIQQITGRFYAVSAPNIVFYELLGVLALLVLWSALRVLRNIDRGEIFTFDNARRCRTAAYAFYAASLLTFARMLLHLTQTPNVLWVLSEYNTLAVPVALVAAMLCRVLSHTFRVAAELKQDNDLVI